MTTREDMGDAPLAGLADEPAAKPDEDLTSAAGRDESVGAEVPSGERTDWAVVEHEGQLHQLSPEHVLTFGRAASCTICLGSEDRGISRLAGTVEHDSGTWWLWNRSSVRALTVVDELGIRSVVAPGRRIAVAGKVTVVVEGTIRRHAMVVRAESTVPGHTASGLHQEGDEPSTTPAGVLMISALDRLALVSLFSGYLEAFPRYDPHPRSYADASAMLAWPRTTLVKRIEHVRTRLTNAGVPNLVGDAALEHLAEWALTSGVLTREDLRLIGR